MKKVLFIFCLFINTYALAQKQFSSKEEALSWLRATFEQKFDTNLASDLV